MSTNAWQCCCPIIALLIAMTALPVNSLTAKTIAVRVFVDEEEPRVREVWERTLARRVHEASRILSRYSKVKFAVTKFSTWNSDDRIQNFSNSMTEFEKEASPYPAQLAIGFTSQYRIPKKRSTLGGTRGPLRKHILLREDSPRVIEPEKLEALVHELAHYLGAGHSSHMNSVMRPVVGDGRVRTTTFQIAVDPVNASILKLVTDEMDRRNASSIHNMTLGTRLKLLEKYKELNQNLPKDPVAKWYISYLDKSIAHSQKLKARGLKPNSSPAKNTLIQPIKPNIKIDR